MKLIELAARGIDRAPAVSKVETGSAVNPTDLHATAQRCANCGTVCNSDLCDDCYNCKQFQFFVKAAARLSRRVKK